MKKRGGGGRKTRESKNKKKKRKRDKQSDRPSITPVLIRLIGNINHRSGIWLETMK